MNLECGLSSLHGAHHERSSAIGRRCCELVCITLLSLMLSADRGSWCQAEEIVIGFMAMTSNNNYFQYNTMGASVPLAIEDLRQSRDNILPNYTLTYVTQPDECDKKVRNCYY